MGLWSKEQLRAFIKENNLVTAQDAQNAVFRQAILPKKIVHGSVNKFV